MVILPALWTAWLLHSSLMEIIITGQALSFISLKKALSYKPDSYPTWNPFCACGVNWDSAEHTVWLLTRDNCFLFSVNLCCVKGTALDTQLSVMSSNARTILNCTLTCLLWVVFSSPVGLVTHKDADISCVSSPLLPSDLWSLCDPNAQL